MRNWMAVVVAQRHAVALGGAVTHRGEKLKRREERVNANTFACERFEVGLLGGCDVFQVAAHATITGSPYVAVRLREHQEGKPSGQAMGAMLACLRGWHPALAAAELQALLPNAKLSTSNSPRWVQVASTTPAERSAALQLASGLQCFLLSAVIHQTTSGDQADLMDSMQRYLQTHRVEGTVAVRAWKQGGKIPGWSLTELTGRLGGILSEMGHTIDLEHPEHVLALVADGPHQALALGWMEGDGQAAFSNGERRAAERPYFKPVSLDPMLARLAINLATGPVTNGPLVDPMTGTGGFLIEASLSGRPCIGIDIHSEMVHGAQANLAWAHNGNVPSTSQIVRGDATRLEDVLPKAWHGKVGGFVLDPPYGRNSHGSMDTMALVEACLTSAQRMAAQHAGFVLILPIHPPNPHPEQAISLDEPVALLHGEWRELLAIVKRCGWHPESAHVERVHRSLSRLILHARCVPQD